ncbi:hypothetical protein FIBSPDRAFT_946521 [Athelia psychrophila]|uniref:Uncharacterized protein n=1 Tax=Athelia psychrophila TaxID=1759441 RepID=A0A166SMP1_9AGAM|nr:hypothetical protein FIBSPDRAFT_946521 [Fibularhizoctonia sp. CBS 109695]
MVDTDKVEAGETLVSQHVVEADAANGKILDALSGPHNANMATRSPGVPTSKRLEVFCVRTFAELHPADKYPIAVYTICPGYCHSELAREAGWGLYIMKLLLARGPEVGSRGPVYATQQVRDPPMGQKVEKGLRNELVETLEKISPGAMQN